MILNLWEYTRKNACSVIQHSTASLEKKGKREIVARLVHWTRVHFWPTGKVSRFNKTQTCGRSLPLAHFELFSRGKRIVFCGKSFKNGGRSAGTIKANSGSCLRGKRFKMEIIDGTKVIGKVSPHLFCVSRFLIKLHHWVIFWRKMIKNKERVACDYKLITAQQMRVM